MNCLRYFSYRTCIYLYNQHLRGIKINSALLITLLDVQTLQSHTTGLNLHCLCLDHMFAPVVTCANVHNRSPATYPPAKPAICLINYHSLFGIFINQAPRVRLNTNSPTNSVCLLAPALCFLTRNTFLIQHIYCDHLSCQRCVKLCKLLEPKICFVLFFCLCFLFPTILLIEC